MEGRSVFDAVRTIVDILEFAEITNTHGILVAIDFEKESNGFVYVSFHYCTRVPGRNMQNKPNGSMYGLSVV